MSLHPHRQDRISQKNKDQKQKKRIMHLLRLGQSYSVIATSVGVARSKVTKLARETGLRSRFSLEVEEKKAVKKSMPVFKGSMKKELPEQVRLDFALLVRRSGITELPHQDQCKHIFSLEGHGQEMDHYCQNKREKDKPYCKSCMQILYVCQSR